MTVIEKQVPLLDLQAQHRQIREEVLAEIVRVVINGTPSNIVTVAIR